MIKIDIEEIDRARRDEARVRYSRGEDSTVAENYFQKSRITPTVSKS
jgi:hypothetical protein